MSNVGLCEIFSKNLYSYLLDEGEDAGEGEGEGEGDSEGVGEGKKSVSGEIEVGFVVLWLSFPDERL